MKFFHFFITGWALLQLFVHLLAGLVLSLLFVHDGIHDNPLGSRIFIWWNRRLCRIFRARIETHGELCRDTCFYVMNHISWFDIPLLASQHALHFLSKAEVRDWPLIGWLTRRAGTLFIQRGAAGAAQKSLQEMSQCLRQGGSIVIFPEGTTTDGTSLRRFHSRLFQAAIDARVKIQPVALRYPYRGGINTLVPYIDQRSFMDSLRGLLYSRPLVAQLYFLPPIDAHLQSDNIDRKQLAQMAQQAIEDKLRNP